MTKPAAYTSDNIDILHGLEAVRKSPTMYIGSVDSDGRFLVVREPLDNALDEYLAGRASLVALFFHKDGSYTIVDDGPGIPQGTKQVRMVINGKEVVNKIPTMQAVFGELNTSGKYRSDAYKVSRGSHGIGVKATNATSTSFQAWSIYHGKCYSIRFEKGRLVEKLAVCKPPKRPDGKYLAKGTMLTFSPDPTIIKAKSFPMSMLDEWASVTAYMSPGFRILAFSPDMKMRQWYSKLGPVEYVHARQKSLNVQPFAGTEKHLFEYHDDLVDTVVSFTTLGGTELRGYTNGLHNKDGGVHVDSVLRALYKGLVPHAKAKQTFTQIDFRDGLVGLVNAKLHKAQFTNQAKDRLTDDRLSTPEFEAAVTAAATEFFAKNKGVAAALCTKAAQFSELRKKFNVSATAQRELNKIKKQGMPIKYAGADPRTKPAERELFLVEGDSAGGPAKEARHPHQGILPLKGKILNVWRDPKNKALESDEIIYIFAALGLDPKAADPYAKLQYHKIIFLADPDHDGAHINLLLTGLLYKYLPDLFAQGRVYVAATPEFYTHYKGLVYGDGVSQVRAKLDKLGAPASVEIHHIKGWGEVSPEEMRVFAFDASTRKLIQVTPADGQAIDDFVAIMSQDTAYRKQLLGIDVEDSDE